MLDAIGDYISVGFGAVITVAILLGLLLGTIGPAWEGTKNDRYNFWVVFLPCLIFLMLLCFWLGKVFG